MTALGLINSANLNGGQKLATKYFSVALVLFGAQILFGLLAGIQYLKPDFLYGVLDFSVNRMVHINALVIWRINASHCLTAMSSARCTWKSC